MTQLSSMTQLSAPKDRSGYQPVCAVRRQGRDWTRPAHITNVRPRPRRLVPNSRGLKHPTCSGRTTRATIPRLGFNSLMDNALPVTSGCRARVVVRHFASQLRR